MFFSLICTERQITPHRDDGIYTDFCFFMRRAKATKPALLQKAHQH